MSEERLLEIRAHTLLCLQGYRGLGYSPEFIKKMDEVTTRLRNNPDTMVRIITAPDIFCRVCPNLVDDRCISSDNGLEGFLLESPDNSIVSDRQVLSKLGFKENETHSWSEILGTIASKVTSEDMDDLCGDCRWREFEYCARALDKLSSTHPGG